MNHIQKSNKKRSGRRTKRNIIVLLGLLTLCAGITGISQLTAKTPPICDNYGKPLPSSVAELKQVTLNGRKEWISIRGQNKKNPVLLFLAGGPGGSQMAAVRHDLAELEKHFVIVNWDQAGSGKSYGSVKRRDITVDTYIEDGLELADYLCKAFEQEKIYLLGESWGSALGVFLIDRAPELFHAFIGTGQMVSFLDTETTDYQLALSLARKKGDSKTVKKLEKNGKPPYYGKDVTWKSAVYLNYLSAYMTRNPEIQNSGYNTFRDLFSSEYGMIDKVNYLRGIVNTFNTVYPQLYGIDLRTDFPSLEVPVYFFLGRHDINAPISLAEDYYNVLSAPHKEIVWFEHSGHSPWINENKQFAAEVIRVVQK